MLCERKSDRDRTNLGPKPSGTWIDDGESLDSALKEQRNALRDTVFALLNEHKSEFPWWSIPALGVNYDPARFEQLRKQGYHGPLWQHMRALMPPAAPRRQRRNEAHDKPKA